MAHTGAHLDLSAFSSPEELSTLGLDRLKSALIALGLKCGGTLQVGSADTADYKGLHTNYISRRGLRDFSSPRGESCLI